MRCVALWDVAVGLSQPGASGLPARLYSRNSGKVPRRDTPLTEARILEVTRRVPADGSTHWSTRKLATTLGVSHMRVVRVWAKHGLKPQRLDRYMASNDPAFESKTAEIIGLYLNPPQHAAMVADQPAGKAIHVIADNLSAHKNQRSTEFLQIHSHVHLHFTPTYSSWMNQVELWFAKIERDVIARSVFTSVKDLERKLMRYIRHYNKATKIVRWKYGDPSRRIGPQLSVTGH